MEPINEREHPELTNTSNEDGVLSENSLRQLSKGLAKLIPKDCEDIDKTTQNHVQSLHQNLLRTAGSTGFSPKHGAAALNSLCGLLEQCSTSSVPQLRALCSDASSWTRAFQIFLRQSESNKAKPIRRLFLTLRDLLLKHSIGEEKRTLIQHVVASTAGAICKEQNIASIKPAIQALEHFLLKKIVNASDVVFIAAQKAGKPQTTKQGQQSFTAMEPEKIPLSPAQQIESIEDFALRVLEWVQYPDCAPAAGRLLSTFFQSLELDQGKPASSTLGSQQPLWISPVKQALKRHSSLLEVYEHHILPKLLRLGAADTSAFLKTLPFDDIQRGNVGTHEVADIQLCLLAARIGAGSNLVTTEPEYTGRLQENRENPDSKKSEEETGVMNASASKQSVWVDSERLGMNLLGHAASNVRIAALSLLVSASNLTKPFSRQVFDRLRVCLPLFQVEVNPKPRNEFITLMKRFCTRLRGATISILRSSHELAAKDHNVEGVMGDTIPRNRDHTSAREESLISHLAFRRWYMSFLLDELRPTASYQSHITALKILHALFDEEYTGRPSLSKINLEYFDALVDETPSGMHLRPLTDLLMDPFDDVRQAAAEVLEIDLLFNLVPAFPTESGEAEGLDKDEPRDGRRRGANGVIHSDLSRAESKARMTGRADHADGVGKLYNLLYSSSLVLDQTTAWYDCNFLIVEHLLSALEKEVKVANEDLPLAVGNASLHGHLIALRYITSRPDYFKSLHASTSLRLEKWRDFNERLFFVCGFVWVAVADVLCFDAPEGHVLDDDEADVTGLGPKDTLSFCWRALKESSSLLNIVLKNKGYSPLSPSNQGLQYNDYLGIGNLGFVQLAELRHRGAFSTVSLTFAACCITSTRSSDPEIASLPWNWYRRTLECIQESGSALTRRSAGIPAMITGILAAHQSEDFFNDVVHDLQAIADAPVEDLKSEGARLPQVHALNCLKDVFTDARFGFSTERHIADTIEIAVSCLESHVWAIRNCGLMLFKALLRRLNGGTDTASTKIPSSHRQSSHLVYEKYTNIPILILRLLQIELSPNGRGAVQAHKVFPALEIIERSGMPLQYQAEITEALWYYARSPDWSIREKAAKALSCVLGDRDLYKEAKATLTPSNGTSQNALHGRLLCLRFLLAQAEMPLRVEALHMYERLVPLLKNSWEVMVVSNPCPITAAAYLNIRADLFIILLQSGSPAARDIHDARYIANQSSSQKALQTAEGPIMVLKDALERCLRLDLHVIDFTKNNGTYSFTKFLHNEAEILSVLDEARGSISDEETMAIFRKVPPSNLRMAIDLFCPAEWNPVASYPPRDPRQADFVLALRGYDLGAAYGRREDQKEVDTWICQLIMAGSERSELCARLAAVHSLKGFIDEMCKREDHPKHLPELLGVYLALFDTLVDDDEDVRDQGAKTVSLLLSAVKSKRSPGSAISFSLSPPAAKRRLTRFLEKSYRKSKELWFEAVERLIGIQAVRSARIRKRSNDPADFDEEIFLQLRPVAELSIEARTTYVRVFVEEKQNLYIDSVREADEWATTMVQLDPDAWDPNTILVLESWTVEGLTYYIDTYEDHIDSALSPISKPEVYTLFMRVILSARVLMSRSAPASGKGKAKEDACKGLLEKLLELGKQRLLHDLLLDRIKWILEGVKHPNQQS